MNDSVHQLFNRICNSYNVHNIILPNEANDSSIILPKTLLPRDHQATLIFELWHCFSWLDKTAALSDIWRGYSVASQVYYATRSVGFNVSGEFRIRLQWWPANRKAIYKTMMMIKNGKGLGTRSMSHFFSCKSQSLICGCSTASSFKSQFVLKGTRIHSVCTWQTFNIEAHIAGTACWLTVSHLCSCLAYWGVCSSCFSCITLFFLKILTHGLQF